MTTIETIASDTGSETSATATAINQLSTLIDELHAAVSIFTLPEK